MRKLRSDSVTLSLSNSQRIRLTLETSPEYLRESLPAVLMDEDEGIAEALRGDAEIEANPDQAISFSQLDYQIQNRRS